MAGRGRGSTLPSWMTDGVGAHSAAGAVSVPEKGAASGMMSAPVGDYMGSGAAPSNYVQPSYAPPPQRQAAAPATANSFSAYADYAAPPPLPSYPPPPPRAAPPSYAPGAGGGGYSAGPSRTAPRSVTRKPSGSSVGRASRPNQRRGGPAFIPDTGGSMWDKRPTDLSPGEGYPEHYGLGVVGASAREARGGAFGGGGGGGAGMGGAGMGGAGMGGGGMGGGVYGGGGGSGGGNAYGGSSSGHASAQEKNQRKLYIGNTPHGVPSHALSSFLEEAIRKAFSPQDYQRLCGGRPPVIDCYVGAEKNFGFVELSSFDLTASVLLLDQVNFDGFSLRIKRPKTFDEHGPQGTAVMPDREALGLGAIGMGGAGGGGGSMGGGRVGADGISSMVPDGPGKIFVGGIPHHLADEQVKELLQTFGPLKAFNLIKDQTTGKSKGYGFCEYVDHARTADAVGGLNGLQIGEKVLTVNYASGGRASAGAPADPAPRGVDITGMSADDAAQAALASAFGADFGGGGGYGGGAYSGGAYGAPPAPPMHAPPTRSVADQVSDMQGVLATKVPTRVVKLTDMVSASELEDESEFRDIALDVRQECSASGTVLAVIMPRARDGYPADLQGNIYVEFSSAPEAHGAALALCGKKFSEKLINCDFIAESKFAEWKARFGTAA